MNFERFSNPATNQEQEVAGGESERILNNIDRHALKSIFDERRKKSGVTKNEPAERLAGVEIVGEDHDSILGEVAKGKIYIYPLGVERYANTHNRSYENVFASVLMHEETHAAGFNQEGENPATVLQELKEVALSHLRPKTFSASGYSVSEARDGAMRISQYNFFNEAVTDRIAEEVFAEYKTRKGLGADPNYETFAESYLPQRALLDSFLNQVAQEVGIPNDVVWKSVQQGYFSGLNLSDTTLGKLYKELSLTEIMNGIRSVNDAKDILPLIQKMNLSELPEESKERVAKGMDEFQQLVVTKQAEQPDEFFKQLHENHYKESGDSIADVRKRLGL